MRFFHDTYFDETIETPEGPVRVFAETQIFADHLVLDELLCFPRDQPELSIGVNQVLRIRRQLEQWAAEDGFAKLTAIDHRLGARNKDTITHTRRLS